MNKSNRKKRKALGSRCKRMRRSQRLQAARAWLEKYSGKYVICDYRKHFAVDRVCAILELRMLGISIGEDQLTQAKAVAEASALNRRRKKERARRTQEAMEAFSEFDEAFAFIVEFTEGGAPIGVTWEEREKGKKLHTESDDDDEIPF